MKDNTNYFEVNKATWNKKVAIHAKSDMYAMEAFKSGKSSLMSYELKALGNVDKKSLLHLQCHFGQDTLSWARLGAKCVGVDLSNEGVKLAKQLNEELGLDAKFVCCNVLDTSKHISETFDIVYTSYGVIGWLPDLKPWAKMIADRLKVGGVFYMVEFHPILWMFDYVECKSEMRYHYNQDDVIYEEYKGTYTNSDADIVSKEYGWNHGFGEVVSSLVNAGLEIEFLHEFEKSPYNSFPEMDKTSDGMYVLKEEQRMIPLLYSIRATKK